MRLKAPKSPALASFVAAVLIVLSGCLNGGPSATDAPGGGVPVDWPLPLGDEHLGIGALAFQPPVLVDAARPGGEPVLLVTREGTLILAAHPGPTHSSPLAGNPDTALVTSLRGENLVWRSTDHGVTWHYVAGIGAAGARDGAFSISDPDLTQDEAGNIYHVSLYNPGEGPVGLGISVSSDDGETWTANPLVPGGDRPWISARGEHEVFVATHGSIYRSVPGSQGLEYQFAGTSPFRSPDTNLQVGPDGALYHGGYPGVARSADDGANWETLPGGPVGADSSGWMMAEPVFDAAGNLYAAYFAGNHLWYAVWNPSGDFIANHQVASLRGSHLWPWMVAGDNGRIALVWIGSDAAAPSQAADWRLYAAFVTDAVTDPRGQVAIATPDPIHRGPLCQSGVGCAALSDRRLGDFITAAVDINGDLLIASAATEFNGEASNGWWGRPIVVRQAEGPQVAGPAGPGGPAGFAGP